MKRYTNSRILPPQEELARLFNYDASSGQLTWRLRTPDQFDVSSGKSTRWKASVFNSKNAGKPALNCLNGQGYRHGVLFGTYAAAHRVIWKLIYGFEPDQIDHINHDRADNRLSNLRAADHYLNAQNRSLPTNNRSGVIGVWQDGSNAKWHAQITAADDLIDLGLYDTLEQATIARRAAERVLRFHENHGR